MGRKNICINDFLCNSSKIEAYKFIGSVFSRLTVIDILGVKNRATFVRCRCFCGNIKDTYLVLLKGGAVKSCGCLRKENLAKKLTTHGDTHSRLFTIWVCMRKRCSNENHEAFPNYGGRGINVCEDWNSSYIKFKIWAILNGYDEKLELDRKNNNGNYEPSNCHWVTRKQNQNNKRNTVLIEFKGEIKTLSDWCDLYGLRRASLYSRIFKQKWSIDKAFEVSISKLDKSSTYTFEYKGEIRTLSEWARLSNISYQILLYRVFEQNWSPEKAFTTPVRKWH